jgi:hypothetical protein
MGEFAEASKGTIYFKASDRTTSNLRRSYRSNLWR